MGRAIMNKNAQIIWGELRQNAPLRAAPLVFCPPQMRPIFIIHHALFVQIMAVNNVTGDFARALKFQWWRENLPVVGHTHPTIAGFHGENQTHTTPIWLQIIDDIEDNYFINAETAMLGILTTIHPLPAHSQDLPTAIANYLYQGQPLPALPRHRHPIILFAQNLHNPKNGYFWQLLYLWGKYLLAPDE